MTLGRFIMLSAEGLIAERYFHAKRITRIFWTALVIYLEDTKTPCYAWALIPNHFHLLLRTGTVPVSIVMKRLLTGYAVSYNLRHRRFGHLFQNRYKSILCQEDPYLLELVRYIHLNPLRAGQVSDYSALGRHPYCGHAVILGQSNHNWQNTEYVLRLFGDKAGNAKRRYGEFVKKGIEQGKRPDLIGGGLLRSQGGWEAVKALRKSGSYQKGDERILGDGDFVEKVLSQAEEKFQKKYQIRAEGYDLEKLIRRVAEIMEIESEKILERGKDHKKTQARSVLCYWATEYLGISQMELSQILKLSQPAVSQAVYRGSAIIKSQSYSL